MPSFNTAQSLLSLPAGITHPDPYAVFGLQPGEPDSAAIARAIQAVVARLNAAKPAADPAAWQQAALWVKRSRGILLDPALKSQLDQRVYVNKVQPVQPSGRGVSGLEAQSAMVEVPAAQSAAPLGVAADDPLAGLLPGVGPAAAVQQHTTAPVFRAGPAHFAGSQASRGGSPGPPAATPPSSGGPPSRPPAPLADDSPAASAVAAPWSPSTTSAETFPGPISVPVPVVKRDAAPGRRRRRRFPWAAAFLTLLTVVCVGGIAGMIYMLGQSPAGVVISLQPRAGETTAGRPAAAVPSEPRSDGRQPVDPIMGRLGTESANPRTRSRSRDNPESLAAADDWLASLPEPADEATESIPSSDPLPIATPALQEDTMAVPATGKAPEPAMPAPAPTALGDTGLGDAGPSAAGYDAAEEMIGTAREAILKANWSVMVDLAEAAQEAAVTPEQKAQAGRLYQLADLASYYHGGIEKGLQGLGAGESFDVTDQLQIVVVEIGDENVVFRFSGRNKEYPRSQLPLVLAHRIARFAISPETPTSIAAKNAYQAVAPISTPQYRQQAIAALEAITDEVEGAKPEDVAAAIRDVFGE